MGYFLAGLLILAILWYVISALRPRGEAPQVESADDVTACPVRLTLLTVAPLQIDPQRLIADYQALWDESLACAHTGPPDAPLTYRLSTGEQTLWLTLLDEPLPPGDSAMLGATSPRLRDADHDALGAHTASAVLHYRQLRNACPAQGTFVVKALHALLRDPDVLGYVATSALRYVSRAAVDGVCAEHDPLSPVALYLLFVNTMREETADGRRWLHTHGLEQFGLPELHLFPDDGDDADDAEIILANTAIYSLTNGPVLQPGQTAELAGDGALFDIRRFPNGALGHDGLCGMLLLVKHGAAPVAEWV
ncbi:MAG TPA: DUF4261 domain-containing protein [Armatimonadota bacterium]|nr:DUF4261 domain-containing protein [Armatimonadota bacterium]HOS42292.1 DUF4261 domain-containing protein [Armatimonadota bacterium]